MSESNEASENQCKPAERAWVDEYLRNGFNATDASRTLGYKAPDRHGCRIAKRPHVQNAIRERLEGYGLGVNEVLAHLSDIARGTIGDFIEVTDDGEFFVNLESARKHGKMGLIKKLRQTKYGTEVEFHSRLAALQTLANLYRIGEDGGALGQEPQAEHIHIVIHEPRTREERGAGSGSSTTAEE